MFKEKEYKIKDNASGKLNLISGAVCFKADTNRNISKILPIKKK